MGKNNEGYLALFRILNFYNEKIFIMCVNRRTWAAQLVEQVTLGVCSGVDLRAVRSRPVSGSTLGAEPASTAPSIPPPSQIQKPLKKRKRILSSPMISLAREAKWDKR